MLPQTTATLQHLVTLLFIDNVEDIRFKAITGNTRYVDNSASHRVWLEKGVHIIDVRYRTPGTITSGG